MSLDGFIAGPNGEYDWIVPDPSIDFAAIFAEFDTLLMGRHTYELAISHGNKLAATGQRIVVVSSTLSLEEHQGIMVLSSGIAEAVAALKAQPGKDIWLFGGGILFRSMLDAGLVDTVEVSLIPVMLGAGIPLLPEDRRQQLHLEQSTELPSGVLMLNYSVPPGKKHRPVS
jgi:dihydrofolate reductase